MPSFVGGLAEGLQGFPQEIGQLVEAMRQRKVAAALGRTMAAPPQTQAPPTAALAALGPQSRPGVDPGMSSPTARSIGQPQADPLAPLPEQPKPGQPTGRPGAEAPTGMSVDPGLADPVKEGQSLIQNLWRSTQAANPDADPMTIMKAVEYQIGEIKGVAPITKATMQGQIAYMRAQTDYQYKTTRLQQYDHDWMVKFMNAKTAEEKARMTGEYQKGRLAIMQEHEDTYSQSVDYQHEDRQSAEEGRNTRNAANINSRMSIAELKEQGLDDRSAAAIKGRHGSTIANGVAKVLAINPNADVNATIEALGVAYGGDGEGDPRSAPAPRKSQGGAIPANVQQFAKQHGLKIIRKRADGKYDAKAQDGTVGVIG